MKQQRNTKETVRKQKENRKKTNRKQLHTICIQPVAYVHTNMIYNEKEQPARNL